MINVWEACKLPDFQGWYADPVAGYWSMNSGKNEWLELSQDLTTGFFRKTLSRLKWDGCGTPSWGCIEDHI